MRRRRRFAFGARKARGLDLAGRVHGQDALFGQPGEQHSDCGHMLLDGWRRARVLLDVSRHRDGLDAFEALKASALTPVQELVNRMIVVYDNQHEQHRFSNEKKKGVLPVRSR